MLSAYETPEIRSLYNQSLKNLAGKVRAFRRWAPVQVPDGLDQASESPVLSLPLPIFFAS